MKLIQESWGSTCAFHHFTACQRFVLVTPGHWKAFLQSAGFLLWIQLTCWRWSPDICIWCNNFYSLFSFPMPQAAVNRETVSMRENLSDLISVQERSFILFLHLHLFINALKCIFHPESCKEMFLFLFYPSLDWVKDDFKIIGYIKALLSQEHNKSVN